MKTIWVFLILLLAACSMEDEPSSEDCVGPAMHNADIVCTADYKPVCGCNGLTYENSCLAMVNGVRRWTDGACDCIDESRKNPDGPCTLEYAPVCGCNGVTYGNKCEAMRAGVTSWTEGACK